MTFLSSFLLLQLCGGRECQAGHCLNRLQAIAEYTKNHKYPTSEPYPPTPDGLMHHNVTLPVGTVDDGRMMVDDMMRDMYYAPAHYDYYREEWRFYLNHGQDGDSKESQSYSDNYSGGSKSGGYVSVSKSGPDDRHNLPEWVVYLQNRHLKYSLASYYGYIPDEYESPPEHRMPDDTCPLMTDLDRWWISLTRPTRSPYDGPSAPPPPPPPYGEPTGPPYGDHTGKPGEYPGDHSDYRKPDIMEEWDFRHLRCTQRYDHYGPYGTYPPYPTSPPPPVNDDEMRCAPYWFEKMPDIPEFELPPRKHDFAIPYYVVPDNEQPDPTKVTHRPSPPPPRPSPSKPPKQEEALYVLTPLYGWQYVYFGDGHYPYPEPYPHNTTTIPPYYGPYSPSPSGELAMIGKSLNQGFVSTVHGLFMLAETDSTTDSNSDSKPDGHVVLHRNFYTTWSQIHIPVLATNYGNRIRV